jgi:hypothetical protein
VRAVMCCVVQCIGQTLDRRCPVGKGAGFYCSKINTAMGGLAGARCLSCLRLVVKTACGLGMTDSRHVCRHYKLLHKH